MDSIKNAVSGGARRRSRKAGSRRTRKGGMARPMGGARRRLLYSMRASVV